MPRTALTLVIGRFIGLVIGRFAMAWHLPAAKAGNLTETVFAWRGYGPTLVPLPHPSPRNNIWLKAHPWFARDLVPALQQTVRAVQMAPA
jgi:uracil-DNA glycosylase